MKMVILLNTLWRPCENPVLSEYIPCNAYLREYSCCELDLNSSTEYIFQY